tara:strand:+ start:1083 stop:1241 length:159 start_codon:yes stop_codon:yes gene_type:complete
MAALIGDGVTDGEDDLALDMACLCAFVSDGRFGKRICAIDGDANRTAVEQAS